MPFERLGFAQFALLLLVVPLQYFFTTYYSSSEAEIGHELKKLVSTLTRLKQEYFSFTGVRKHLQDVIAFLEKFKKSKTDGNYQQSSVERGKESPAVEVLNYRNSRGYFADSLEPRSPKVEGVQFRIGQVVRHKVHGYRGVIIGWDSEPKAPDHWLERNFPKDKERWKSQPCYLLLVDARDRSNAQKTYVPQYNLQILVDTKVEHPEIEEYFDEFDSIKYIPKTKLKKLFPHD